MLSKTVADCFNTTRILYGNESDYNDTTETEAFCRIFNKWFDCFNTRNLYESKHKRNDDLKAYTSIDDERIKVIILQC